jgi:hypothetical protein
MEWKYIIAVILLALVLVIALPSALYAFNNIYKNNIFFKPSWDSLSAPEKSQLTAQFDNFVNGINTCISNQKQGCVCNALVSFPDAVSIKLSYLSNEKISLMYGSTEVKNITMQSGAFLHGISFSSATQIIEGKIPSGAQSAITFSKGEEYFNGNKILSSGFYKRFPSWIGIITAEKVSEAKQTSIISALKPC